MCLPVCEWPHQQGQSEHQSPTFESVRDRVDVFGPVDEHGRNTHDDMLRQDKNHDADACCEPRRRLPREVCVRSLSLDGPLPMFEVILEVVGRHEDKVASVRDGKVVEQLTLLEDGACAAHALHPGLRNRVILINVGVQKVDLCSDQHEEQSAVH